MPMHDRRSFWRDERGNFAMMFGLMIVPIFVLFGMGIDYYKSLSYRARLDAAADAAAIATINTAQAYLLANPGATLATVKSVAEPQGLRVYNANAGSAQSASNDYKPDAGATATVILDSIANQTLKAHVTYSGQVATNFGKVIGRNTMLVGDTAKSQLTMSTFLDFYVLVDSSGSMGLPTDDLGQQALSWINQNLMDPTNQPNGLGHPYHDGDSWIGYQNGCSFACHGSSIDAAGVAGAMPSICNPAGGINKVNNIAAPLETYALPQDGSTLYPYQFVLPGSGGIVSTLGFPNGPVFEQSSKGFCGDIGYMLTRNPSIMPSALYTNSGSGAPRFLQLYPQYANSIPLRADAVGGALQNLLATALATETNVTHIANEFRIGIYPFVNDLVEAAPLSYGLNAASTNYKIAGNMATYLDQGINKIATHTGYNFQDAINGVASGNGGNDMGAGGTHFENLWYDLGGTTTGYTSTSSSPGPSANTYGQAKGAISGATILKGSSTGASALTPKGIIFLVTDGAENLQTFVASSGGFNGSTPTKMSQNAAYSSLCDGAKNAGYTMSVLYIPYVPINPVNAAFASNEDGKVNANVPSFPTDLSNCASPGYFYTASSAAAINAAMQAMFNQATQAARLTQ